VITYYKIAKIVIKILITIKKLKTKLKTSQKLWKSYHLLYRKV